MFAVVHRQNDYKLKTWTEQNEKTPWTKAFQYGEEKKTNVIPPVTASEKGKAQPWRCSSNDVQPVYGMKL